MWSYPKSKRKGVGGHEEYGKKRVELKLIARQLCNLWTSICLYLHTCLDSSLFVMGMKITHLSV